MTEPRPDAAAAGGLLRAAREKQGLHIAALAAAIKVSPRKLEALESGRHEDLPDATFIRALAQTVCRTLKTDARPVLELLPPAPAVALLTDRGGLNAPFRDRPGRDEQAFSLGAVKPLVWAAAALVLGALTVFLTPAAFWSSLLSRPMPTPEARPAPPPAPAPAVAAPAASEVAASAALATAAVPATSGETVFAAPAAAASDAAGQSPAGILQLRSSEASWIEVRDARGQLLLSRTVLPGESVGLDGALPLRLLVGNAAATQLQFRGQPVDLAPRARDNVARLELP